MYCDVFVCDAFYTQLYTGIIFILIYTYPLDLLYFKEVSFWDTCDILSVMHFSEMSSLLSSQFEVLWSVMYCMWLTIIGIST